MKEQSFYNLISEVTYHCFCCVLSIRSESLNPDHTQGKGITKGHSTFVGYLRGCLNTPRCSARPGKDCPDSSSVLQTLPRASLLTLPHGSVEAVVDVSFGFQCLAWGPVMTCWTELNCMSLSHICKQCWWLELNREIKLIKWRQSNLLFWISFGDDLIQHSPIFSTGPWKQV